MVSATTRRDSAGLCFFTAEDGSAGRELWFADPATLTVTRVDVRPGSASSDLSDLADVVGTLYFAANGGIGTGKELWMWDAAANQARQVWNINPGTAAIHSNPAGLRGVGALLYFSAERSNTSGRELFAFDPTLPASSSNPRELALEESRIIVVEH